MSGRSAKRARQLGEPAPGDRGPRPGGLLEYIHNVPDRCSICGEAHHAPLYPRKPGDPAALSDPWVNDTMVHTTVAAWQVLKEYGVPEDRWLDVLAPVAQAIGAVAAASESFGRRGAMELFWQGLIEEEGEGTYVVEVGRRGITPVGPS